MWVWSKLSSIKWEDAWQERIYGRENGVISVIKGGKSIRVELYCEKKEEAEAFLKQFGGQVRYLKPENWAKKTVPICKPIKIRDRLVITMEHEEAKYRALQEEFAGRELISIPPDMAFGTGDHPTTSTCLRLLCDEAKKYKGKEWKLLDLGCGSGVLSIAGCRLGASQALGIDFDPEAIRVAKVNAARNEVIDSTEFQEGNLKSWIAPWQAEIVMANVFADVIMAQMNTIIGCIKEGGCIIFSGILEKSWPGVKESGERAGLKFSEPIVIGKWVTTRAEIEANT